jgi:hypothetical protein
MTMAVNSQRNWCGFFDLKRRPSERAPLCPRFSFSHWCSPFYILICTTKPTPARDIAGRKLPRAAD